MNETFNDRAGRKVPLSNPEKDLYPSYGFTKARVLDYYRAVAPFILPHLKDRALTLKRYPEGVEKDYFYEKRCPSHRPSWVKTAEVAPDNKKPMTVCLVNDLETLLWAENLASLELHVPLARIDLPDRPDAMVFDLDPGEPADVLSCARVALVLRGLLSGMGLASYIKTSGNKGLHVLVPLDRSETTFADTRKFSKAAAGIMQKHYPKLVTAQMAKAERRAKVFINWSQNDAAKTMIAVYSLRAREKPFVSAPLRWEDVEQADRIGDGSLLQVIHSEVLKRVGDKGDLFREVLMKEQKLPHL